VVQQIVAVEKKISHPRRLLVGRDEVIYIAYKGSTRAETSVVRIERERHPEAKTPILQSPYGLTIDEDDNVYVADRGSHQLYKFDREMQLIIQRVGTVKTSGRYDDEFCYPHGVGYINGLVYVCDNGSCRVKVYNKSLQFQYSFGDRKKDQPFEKQTLYGPTDIAADSTDGLYVTDNKKMAVVKFKIEPDNPPTFVLNMGQKTLRMPSGIAIDAKDFIYVTDRLKNCIIVFHPLGPCICEIGKKCMQSPRGITCAPPTAKRPSLYVADYNDDGVNVWKFIIDYE
jgi:hypothetical protein